MIKKQFSLLFLIFTFSTVFISCSQKKLKTETLMITTKEGQTFYVDAEIASTQEERNFGFMERKKIPDGTGMLFIFEFL